MSRSASTLPKIIRFRREVLIDEVAVGVGGCRERGVRVLGSLAVQHERKRVLVAQNLLSEIAGLVGLSDRRFEDVGLV